MRLAIDLAGSIRDTKVGRGEVSVFWLGQASFVYKGSSGTTVAVDPFFSDIVEKVYGSRRLWPAPFPASQLATDVVVCTHDHLDHLDPEAISAIAAGSPKTLFVGPTSCCGHFRKLGVPESRILSLAQDESKTIGGLTLTGVYAEHLTVGDPAIDAIGLLLEMDGLRIYQTGDTVYNAQLQKTGHALDGVDLMVVPINGNYAVMNSRDAALYTKDVKPGRVIPCHYGMFAENTADPYLFVNHLQQERAGVQATVMAMCSSVILQRG